MDPNPRESTPKLSEGELRKAAHGFFAKVQEKTGLDDKKIDTFQEKWLSIPGNRTKYRRWWDAPAIMGEEMYAMFDDIIEFVQDQEGGKSHVFASLHKEAKEVLRDPEGYFRGLATKGKGWMDRGIGFAKSWMNGKKAGEAVKPPPTKIEEEKSPQDKKSDAAETEKEWFGPEKEKVEEEKQPPKIQEIPGEESEKEEPGEEEEKNEADETEEEWFGGGKESSPKEKPTKEAKKATPKAKTEKRKPAAKAKPKAKSSK
jgi:hypothetical protein